MATNLEHSDARQRYMEKRRANNADHVCTCRARQALNKQAEAHATTFREGRLVAPRSFDSSNK
jgi:hypothetical protein